jgi:hypothetical protein
MEDNGISFIKDKYYQSEELIDTTFIKNVSPCWQGIAHEPALLKGGFI